MKNAVILAVCQVIILSTLVFCEEEWNVSGECMNGERVQCHCMMAECTAQTTTPASGPGPTAAPIPTTTPPPTLPPTPPAIVDTGYEWKQHNNMEYSISPWNNLPAPHAGDRYTFDAARQKCQGQGGDLASIPDQETFDWIKDNLLPGFSGSCSYKYLFLIGLVKPEPADACSTDGCQVRNAEWCAVCRQDWSWLDGSTDSSWTQWMWEEQEPDRGNRLTVVNECKGYTFNSVMPTWTYRFICSRAASAQ